MGLESGGLPLPLNGLGRETVAEAVMGEGRREKGAEEVEEQIGSGKCCSRLFSWLRSRPDTLGVTINLDTPPERAGRFGQLLPTEVPIFEGVGSATSEDNISQNMNPIQVRKMVQTGKKQPQTAWLKEICHQYKMKIFFIPFLVLTVKTGSISFSDAYRANKKYILIIEIIIKNELKKIFFAKLTNTESNECH